MQTHSYYRNVPTSLAHLRVLQDEFEAWYRDTTQSLPWLLNLVGDRPFNLKFTLDLALAEAFTNAVRHAHAQLDCETPINIDITATGDCIALEVWDSGPPFDPSTLPEYDPAKLDPNHLPGGGYGWHLLNSLGSQVSYTRHSRSPSATADRNCLRFVILATETKSTP